ncbi:MAG: hypothetical protein HY996_01750 [Micrococcales bacterium]|nr:hypothetical protein [Micrococcales bacterium]
MTLDILAVVVSVAAAVMSFVAIFQTRRYQNRADLRVTWDRIGLAGGIEERAFGSGSSAFTLPFMRLRIYNFGEASARNIVLTTTSSIIGTTQETDDGVRPYQETPELLAGADPWEVWIPLKPLRESFDHPFQVLDDEIVRPSVTLYWRKEYSGRTRKKTVTLDGRWLTNYQDATRAR